MFYKMPARAGRPRIIYFPHRKTFPQGEGLDILHNLKRQMLLHYNTIIQRTIRTDFENLC